MRYPIVIERDDERTAYGVVVPDLPGCFSAGDSFDEAVSNAVEAATLWIEDAIETGRNVPALSTLEALQALVVLPGLQWVWGFATVDPALFNDRSERINITIPCRILARLDAQAKAAGETQFGYITWLDISQKI